MRMNNKGLALSGILYTLLVLFLALLFGILGLITSGKVGLDKVKKEVSNKLNGNNEISDIPTIEVSNRRYEITAIFKDDNLVIAYAISDTNTTPTEWTNIPTPSQSYTLKYTQMTTGTYYIFAKDDSNNITSKEFVLSVEACEYVEGKTWNFEYTGTESEFVVPCYGKYKLETWGAQGGDANTTYIGGYGAYATGETTFTKNESLYINVGGQGVTITTSGEGTGGYNGGGNSMPTSVSGGRGSGGGATSINLESGLLTQFSGNTNPILIISAGGGGAGYYNGSNYGNGGSGGGIKGVDGQNSDPTSQQITGLGATQSAGGAGAYTGEFGKGARGGNNWGGSAGGGGYYGGGSASNNAGAGGGSSYIGNKSLTNKGMYCYNCTESSVASTKTTTTTNISETATAQYAKIGAGYARITLVSLN